MPKSETVDAGLPILWPFDLFDLTTDTPVLSADRNSRWIQIAKTGKFFSARYGKFEITATDLRSMLANFKTITPIAPTQLPVDYDHLSMDPKKPGDGKAAGWFAGPMELREGGTTLWAEVTFTPPAAESIRNSEYRFVSPSFVKNYVWKDGKNIGTTLIAAAITNHPFLEGMDAVTLSNAMGELAIQLADGGAMEVGQVVSIKPELDPTRVGQSFEILEVAGSGNDAFSKLKDATGAVIGWYRVSDLAPAAVADPAAAAPPAPAPPPAAPKVPGTNPFAKHMSEDKMSETFTLRDTRGQDIAVPADGLQKFVDDQIAAAVTAKKTELVPEGSVVISAAKLGEFESTAQTVVSLRAEVTTLRDQNEAAAKTVHLAAITKRLDRLSQAGKITKPERDHLLKTYGDPLALAAFDEYFPLLDGRPALIHMGPEHGTGVDIEGAPITNAGGQLLALAQSRMKTDGIPLRDALKLVSQERVDLSEQYRGSAPIIGRRSH